MAESCMILPYTLCGPSAQHQASQWQDKPILTGKTREDEGNRMPREAEVVQRSAGVQRWCSLTPTHVAPHKMPEAMS